MSLKGNKNHKKYNRYDLSGDYGIGYTFKNEEFYFDLEDYEKIKEDCWHIDANGYVINGKRKRLHRIIMNLSNSNIPIDHINHKKYDNRKNNLRIVNKSQNAMNQSMSSANTSGFTGVSWHKAKGKWRAYIKINYKQKDLGYYDSFEDAKQARLQAENERFGEYSYKNSMKVGE
ncbi:MAG: HNH endonuclease [Paludibacteraceae bacterium]|nr:HNH endonuclease [Paludibacteraceae bacterium]